MLAMLLCHLSQRGKFTVEPLDKLVKNDLYLPPRAKLNVYRNTLRYSGVLIWNDLPANVKHVQSVQIHFNKCAPSFYHYLFQLCF